MFLEHKVSLSHDWFCPPAPQMSEVRDKPVVSYMGDSAVMTCKLEETKPKPSTWNWFKANGTEKVGELLGVFLNEICVTGDFWIDTFFNIYQVLFWNQWNINGFNKLKPRHAHGVNTTYSFIISINACSDLTWSQYTSTPEQRSPKLKYLKTPVQVFK